MTSPPPPASAAIDAIDAKIARCLQLAPRGRFSRIGEVLDVSERTVARHYRRLAQLGAVRVRGVVPLAASGLNSWLVRARTLLADGPRLADRLAERDETHWVVVCAGGAEVVWTVRSANRPDDPPLSAADLELSQEISPALVLKRYVSAPSMRWAGLENALTAAQEQAMLAEPPVAAGDGSQFDDADRPLLTALAVDGRATVATLAKASGLTGRALAARPQVVDAAAITGEANLAVAVACRDAAELYQFVTETVGALDGVHTVEVLPVLRRMRR